MYPSLYGIVGLLDDSEQLKKKKVEPVLDAVIQIQYHSTQKRTPPPSMRG